ncbi:hypothetical protein BV20DRAFT_823393 [Pilatotrama ljubarskyi]|nr:hypothetical protein BV20DRAFT_823393 [Pilatotrama ljubarskyi]
MHVYSPASGSFRLLSAAGRGTALYTAAVLRSAGATRTGQPRSEGLRVSLFHERGGGGDYQHRLVSRHRVTPGTTNLASAIMPVICSNRWPGIAQSESGRKVPVCLEAI